MSAVDPFTAATATYRAAVRHPHYSGSAYRPAPATRRRINWPRIGQELGRLGCVASGWLLFFGAFQVVRMMAHALGIVG